MGGSPLLPAFLPGPPAGVPQGGIVPLPKLRAPVTRKPVTSTLGGAPREAHHREGVVTRASLCMVINSFLCQGGRLPEALPDVTRVLLVSASLFLSPRQTEQHGLPGRQLGPRHQPASNSSCSEVQEEGSGNSITLLTIWCQTPFKIWESMAKAKPHFFISLDKFSTESRFFKILAFSFKNYTSVK